MSAEGVDRRGRARIAENLALVSFALATGWYVSSRVILPNLDVRIDFIRLILEGRSEPPYQYRVLKHLVALPLEALASWFTSDEARRHAFAYMTITFSSLLGVFVLLRDHLAERFVRPWPLLAAAGLAAVLPLSVTGFMMEGDLITLLAYLAAFRLMDRGAHAWIPLLVAVATLNREQTVWILVLQAVRLHAEGLLSSARSLATLAAGALSWAAVFFALRFYYGFRPTRFTTEFHVNFNTDPHALTHYILPLWIAFVVPAAVLAVLGWGRVGTYDRWALLSLVPYTGLFFLLGKMDELAKYLPALLVLLPPALLALGATTQPAEDGAAHPKTD